MYIMKSISFIGFYLYINLFIYLFISIFRFLGDLFRLTEATGFEFKISSENTL